MKDPSIALQACPQQVRSKAIDMWPAASITGRLCTSAVGLKARHMRPQGSYCLALLHTTQRLGLKLVSSTNKLAAGIKAAQLR